MVAFRLLCWIAASVGQTMVALARAFKACARASTSYGLAVIPVQLVLLLAWAPTRMLFVVLLRAAKGAHRADTELRRRWAMAQ